MGVTVSGQGVLSAVSMITFTSLLPEALIRGGIVSLAPVPVAAPVIIPADVDLAASSGDGLIGFVVSGGSVFAVSAGMSAGGSIIHSGGEEIVLSGGSVGLDQIQAGGTEVVANGGSSFAPEFFGSGATPAVLVVSAGGHVELGNLFSDGVEFVLSGGSDSGAHVDSGSVLEIANGGSATGETIAANGMLALDAGAVVSGSIRFVTSSSTDGGILVISGTTMPNVPILGFDVAGVSQNDLLDFASVGFASGGSATINDTTRVLSVAESGATYDLQLARLPDLTGERLAVTPDGHGGTAVFAEAACFAAGTRIATERGEVAVEALAVGDLARLASDGTAPVVWIGHRRIDCSHHPRREAVWPVRIAPHAFGLGRPARALRLSPDHAVFVDCVLIPIRYLLNGATVAQVPTARVAYYHVELPQHSVLLAEGLPVESYLDTGNRAAFGNGGTAVLAHADFARGVWDAASCAPLVTAGPVRERVYRRLIAQALALGWRAEDAGTAAAVSWRAPRKATG